MVGRRKCTRRSFRTMVRKQSNDVKQKRRSRRSIRHVGRLHHPEAAQSPAGCTYFSWWSGGCSSKTRRTTPAPFGCSICPSGRGSHTASSGGTAATSGRMRSDGRLRRSVAKLEYSYQHGLGVKETQPFLQIPVFLMDAYDCNQGSNGNWEALTCDNSMCVTPCE